MMTFKKWWAFAGVLLLNLVVFSIAVAQGDLPYEEGTGLHTGIPEGSTIIGDMVFAGDDLTRGTHSTNTWPGGIVPYAFDAAVTEQNRTRAVAAMAEWEAVAGVDFVPRTSEQYYINFINSTGNWSYVGRQGGKQDIGMFNWSMKYVIAHELGHALGLWHEQSRPDRDTYITIHLENAPASSHHNFNKVGLAHGAYDFASVMHYDDYAFSNNGQRTIVANPGYESYQNVMGHLAYLSDGDKAVMATLYPNGETPATARPVSNYGYTVSFASAGYTEGDEPFPAACLSGAPLTDTLWFKIPANTSTFDRITTLSAGGYDAVLAIYSGTPQNLTLNGCVNRTTDVEIADFPLLPNTDYYIQIGGWNGSAGTLTFGATFKSILTSNGGFEGGSTGWTIKSIPATRVDDRLMANGKGALNSFGWVQFKGGNSENSTLTQNINITGGFFSTGTTYRFGGEVLSTSVNNKVIIKATVKYANGTRTQEKITQTGVFAAWTPVTQTITLTRADVSAIVLVVNNKSAAGLTRVDNLWFAYESSGGNGGGVGGHVLPLPDGSGTFRGGS